MRTCQGQLDLFGGLPFADNEPKEPEPYVIGVESLPAEFTPPDLRECYDPPDDEPYEPAPEAVAFEAWIRAKGLPFVAIDEAKRAVFMPAPAMLFDFLVYSSGGPNLLVLLDSAPADEDCRTMAEWEAVFGQDFRAVFAWEKNDEWVGIALCDWRGNPAHARALELML